MAVWPPYLSALAFLISANGRNVRRMFYGLLRIYSVHKSLSVPQCAVDKGFIFLEGGWLL